MNFSTASIATAPQWAAELSDGYETGRDPVPDPAADLAGAVVVQRRAEVARFDAYRRLRAAVGVWEAREEAGLRLGLSDREVAALDRVCERASVVPSCIAALRAGSLGWSQLVSIVYVTARTRAGALATIDRIVAAHATSIATVHADHWADEVLEHCERLVQQARDVAAVEQSEETAEVGSRVHAQPSLDGGGVLVCDLDPLLFDEVLAGLDAAAPAPTATGSRARDRAQALGALARGALNDQGTGGAPRVAVQVIVDLTDDPTAEAFGILAGRTRRRTHWLSALTTDVLSCDARVTAVLVDGARPLAELALQDTLPASTRRVVIARDRTCRWPGCRMPAGWSDVHHVRHREDGGTHDPDNLLVLCRRHHRRAHRPAWTLDLHAATARLAVTDPRGRRALSLPAGRRPEVAASR